MVVDFVQDGTHEQPHDGSKNEAGPIVGDITPVADPELPEDHSELGEVRLRVLVLELQRLAALLGDAQLLDQLLILPAGMLSFVNSVFSQKCLLVMFVGRPLVSMSVGCTAACEIWQSTVEWRSE